MANGADCRAGATESLTGKELLPVTTHTSVVIGKVGHIRKFALGIPRCRNLVTVAAREALMFFRSMQERRILRRRSERRLRLSRWSSREWTTPGLCHGDGRDRGEGDKAENKLTFYHANFGVARSTMIGSSEIVAPDMPQLFTCLLPSPAGIRVGDEGYPDGVIIEASALDEFAFQADSSSTSLS